MIEVREVTKRFDGCAAVNNLSFDAPDGAITGLLGANGAGKTTTLRMIAGVLERDAGGVCVAGVDPQTDTLHAQRYLGALLDHTGLYPRLTARENVAYFARLRRIPGPMLDERVETVLADLRLADLADRPVAGFSQGERT